MKKKEREREIGTDRRGLMILYFLFKKLFTTKSSCLN